MKKNTCIKCGAILSSDEIGLYKKLVNRLAEDDFICEQCLAQEFHCTKELLDRKIKQFKENGCMLFQ